MKYVALILFLFIMCAAGQAQYTMPEETAPHEGTWLQWPHNHTYPPFYRGDLEDTWVEMTRELQSGEMVHIIAYDSTEYNYIVNILTTNSVPLTNVDFFVYPNDDCWSRDNGPIFVFDTNDDLYILDWGFNGWGNSTPYALDDPIPTLISPDIGVPYIDLSAMVLEGGAIEVDGAGSMLATKSSIINSNRNPGLTQTDIENYMASYLGITNFIWLDGVAGLEITDMHIDGFARFLDTNTIITMDSLDLVYWQVPPTDISTLYNAQNANGTDYSVVYLPLTQNDVVTTWFENLGYKGSYVNYYVGNDVVLVPTYNDPNDATAIAIIDGWYPTRTAVGIDVRNLYYGGGMVHCVTQQQPLAGPVGVNEPGENIELNLFPNPFSEQTQLTFTLRESATTAVVLYNSIGQEVATLIDGNLAAGKHTIPIAAEGLQGGMYHCTLWLNGEFNGSVKVSLVR